MNFKKLQEMQLALDNSILSKKATMTAEERFSKTLVALLVEIAEVANCNENFKFWKDKKGKFDDKRFILVDFDAFGTNMIFEDTLTGKRIDYQETKRLTLVEEAADCLHFVLSLANQMDYEINRIYSGTKEPEQACLDCQWSLSNLKGSNINDIHEQLLFDLINNYFSYIGNIGILLPELEKAYYDKNEVNYQRLRDGY